MLVVAAVQTGMDAVDQVATGKGVANAERVVVVEPTAALAVASSAKERWVATRMEASSAEQAEALPDRMGATRGGVRVRRGSSVRRGRLNRARVRATPFLGRRGTETSRIASLARRGTIARLRT